MNKEKTLSDEFCSDLMAYEVLPNLEVNHLTETDEVLLIEYAPKLFNTIYQTNKDYIYNVMRRFALDVNTYRFQIIYKEQEDQTYIDTQKHFKNKSHDYKVTAFKSHIAALIKLMGDTPELYAHQNDRDILYNELKKAHTNPNNYIPSKSIFGFNTKDSIRECLVELKLKGKSQEISNFIKELQ